MIQLTLEKAYKLRELIEKAVISLADEDALDGIELFPSYLIDHEYSVGDRFRYGGKLYKVNQAHTSLENWKPDELPALYTEVAPPGVIPVWVQPTGAQDAYNIGDKVHYPTENDPVYESTVDNNVWSPVDYPQGWQIVE